MLKITRDGEKTIDNERQFNKELLPRWKQKWLVFKLGLVIRNKMIHFIRLFFITGVFFSIFYYVCLTGERTDVDITPVMRILFMAILFVCHIMLAGIITVGNCSYPNDVLYKLRKKVLTRLDQIDTNIIDTTLDERMEVAKWFAESYDLVGIKKEENSRFYVLFYEKHGDLVKEREKKYNTPITDEIDKQMIDGYIYSISDLLTYNAPCKIEK